MDKIGSLIGDMGNMQILDIYTCPNCNREVKTVRMKMIGGEKKGQWEILKNEWLDLVLTDYNMPEMNGLELMVEMKKDAILKTVPVVMITTEGSRQRVEEFREKGAADYIKKPFTPEEIRQKLNLIMGENEDGEGSFDNGDEELDF